MRKLQVLRKMANVGKALVQSLMVAIDPANTTVSEPDPRNRTAVGRSEAPSKQIRALLAHLPDNICPDGISPDGTLKDLFFPEKSPNSLHNPSSVKSLIEQLERPCVNANAVNVNGDAPIHAIVKRKCKRKADRKEKVDLLLALFIHGDADVNLQNANGMTALHFTAEACDFESSKVLMAFGANVNIKNVQQKMPLDLIEGPHQFCHISEGVNISQKDAEELKRLLREVGARRALEMELHRKTKPTKVQPFFDVMLHEKETAAECSKTTAADSWVSQLAVQYRELEKSIERRLASVSFPQSPDEAMSLAIQMKELRMYKKAGSRILVLDGGGMRGLVQIEILGQIEEATGRRVTELFDWIIGTSTGGIVALALVYAKMSVSELRQFYFKMKDDIFGNARAGVAFDTGALEKIFENMLGCDSLNDVKHPRVLIPAVSKKTINPKLHIFNNCFDDQFSTQPVCKVARYTSAAPLFFNEMDDYVDGGLLANNPCEIGLTKIQNYYRERGQKFPVSLMVSIGSGRQPEQELGNTDARDFLFFGTHWFNFKAESLIDKTQNLTTLLSNALVESEVIAESCQSRCKEQGILFYRFSPQLEEVIAPGETDSAKLMDMILEARKQIPYQRDFSQLVLQFHNLADANRKVHGTQSVEGSRRKFSKK